MGANPTQAKGVILFLIAFVFIAGGLAANVGVLYLLVGLAFMGCSLDLFVLL